MRYVGNRSSGRMGFALAAEARRRGAHVTLVAGPTRVEPPAVDELVRVRSAAEMHAAVMRDADARRRRHHGGRRGRLHAGGACAAEDREDGRADDADARADADILADLGAPAVAVRDRRPVLVGFAAETGDAVAQAREKRLARASI